MSIIVRKGNIIACDSQYFDAITGAREIKNPKLFKLTVNEDFTVVIGVINAIPTTSWTEFRNWVYNVSLALSTYPDASFDDKAIGSIIKAQQPTGFLVEVTFATPKYTLRYYTKTDGAGSIFAVFAADDLYIHGYPFDGVSPGTLKSRFKDKTPAQVIADIAKESGCVGGVITSVNIGDL